MSSSVDISAVVNGEPVMVDVPAAELLIDTLRERLGLTGTKRSCDVEICGACTVLLDGAPVSACTTLSADMDGRQVTTVEGLAPRGELSDVQRAFVDEGALQCGFCTPGFVVAATALLADQPDADRDEIIHTLHGNICRCGCYSAIVAAVGRVAAERRAGAS